MKIVFLLMLIVFISLNLAHLRTLHGDLLRWATRRGNSWGVPAYCAIVSVIVVAASWLV